MELTDKVAVITGASMGIGQAIAKLFVDRGARVVLLSRDAHRAETVRGEAALVIVRRQQLERARQLPERVGTIVVGNPLIADVSVQSGGLLIVTGKGYGRTNLIVLDRGGNVLLEKTVQVTGPGRDVVVVYRGSERESYSCAPYCERRITLGDAPAYFDATLGQAGTRVGQAMGAAQTPQQR